MTQWQTYPCQTIPPKTHLLFLPQHPTRNPILLDIQPTPTFSLLHDDNPHHATFSPSLLTDQRTHTYTHTTTLKMSPSIVTIDNTPDFDFGGFRGNPAPTTTAAAAAASGRTLLLAPPSVASDGAHSLPTYDRSTTDLHMLDRLSAGLVTLPAETYALVLLLTDADGARHAEATGLLSREVFAALVPAMRAGGKLQTQDGRFGDREVREAVLAGLVQRQGEFEKVEEEEVVVPLRFGKKKNNTSNNSTEINKAELDSGRGAVQSSAGPAVDSVTVNVAGKPTTLDMVPPVVKALPAGVGFDFGDDLDDDDDDDDLIDEDELMTEEDLNRPIQIRTFAHSHSLL